MFPYLLWSEGIDHISVKVDVENAENEHIIIENQKIIVKFNKSSCQYEAEIDLLHPILNQESYYNNYRYIEIHLKKEKNIKWNKLTQKEDSRIQIDWNKSILDSDDDILLEELSDDDLYYSEEEDVEITDNILPLDSLEVESLDIQ
tara:strand:- start:94 stop:531 length:438 start_codon:yes stop_codon:yes gene_type:complete